MRKKYWRMTVSRFSVVGIRGDDKGASLADANRNHNFNRRR